MCLKFYIFNFYALSVNCDKKVAKFISMAETKFQLGKNNNYFSFYREALQTAVHNYVTAMNILSVYSFTLPSLGAYYRVTRRKWHTLTTENTLAREFTAEWRECFTK